MKEAPNFADERMYPMPHSMESLKEWAKEIGKRADCPFTDIKGHWAEDIIKAAYALGLVQGYPDGKFQPDFNPTRAEILTLLVRSHLMCDDSFENIIHDAESAVVTIMKREGGQGSGTHIGGGYILTNAHVVLDSSNKLSAHPYQLYWFSGGYGDGQQAKYAEGPCVWAKPTSDLAIIKAEVGEPHIPSLPKLPLGLPEHVMRGQPIVVIGTPNYHFGTVTQGIVCFVGRHKNYEISPRVYARIPDMIQIDAAVNPGNSGGALVNRRCQLIGVPSVKIVHSTVESMAFCIGLESVLNGIKEARELGAMQVARMSTPFPNLKTMTLLDAESMDEIGKIEENYLDSLDELVELFESQGVKESEPGSQ